MSSISSRPRVQKIAGPVLTTVAAAGAVLAAKAIQGLLRSLMPTGKETLRSSGLKTEASPSLHPVSALREQFEQRRQQAMEQARLRLPPLEALRIASAASLAATPFYMDNAEALGPRCLALQQASTLAEAQRAERDLLTVLEASHQRLFVETLSLACRNAAAKIGFDRVEVIRLPDQVRVITADATGRTLVTEIQADPHRDPALCTEVVGVSDGSCQQILDAFDQALEGEGVRSAPPKRKFTGGVCELAAAREFVRRKPTPLARQTRPVKTKEQSPTERVQRLNRQSAANVKSKG